MKNIGNRSLSVRRGLARTMIAVLALTPALAQQPAATSSSQTPPPGTGAAGEPAPQQPGVPATVQGLKLIPLAGKGEANDLQRHIMAPLVIEVLDQNDRPVEGAEVVFRFPINGPSATFP